MSTSFVSSVIVSMMKESNHIMYIDVFCCSDHGCILLVIFMDYFIQARLSIYDEERKGFIERMKEIERSVNSESEIPVSDYIIQFID